MKISFRSINKLPLILTVVILLISSVLTAQTDTQTEIDSLTRLFSKTIKFDDKKVLLKALSNCYHNKGDWEKYAEVVEQMLLLQDEKVDSFYLAETYNKLGISSCVLGKNKESLEYFYQALEINIAMNMDLIAANSYENLGLVYKDMGNYPKAVECQLKSLELRKEKNSSRMFNNYIKLSIVLELLGDVEKMDYYLGKAKIEINKRDSIRPRDKALFYSQLGEIYSNRGLSDSSIICFRNVINSAKQIGWKLAIADGLSGIADAFHEEEQLDSAIFYYKKSLNISLKISNSQSTTDDYLSLATLYTEANKNDSVMYFANNALQMAKRSDLLREQSEALKLIAEFYQSQQKYKQAYKYIQQHYVLEDSISSSDVKNKVAELGTKYETKLKEQQIELLTTENQIKNQRMWLFIAATVILILAIIIGIFIFIRSQQENLQRQESLKQKLLRSQMNPHFLFNALGSIQNFMLKNETTKAAGYLNNFASLTRNILEHSAQEFVPISEEVDTLRNYLELEKMRLENSFEFKINYDQDLEVDFINIPPMLIQPFIENAIKHGLSKIEYKGLLELSFEEKKSVLHIIIADNGIGINHSKNNVPKTHRSMSMNIFEQRRIVLAKRSKQSIGLEVIDRCDIATDTTGTLVKIKIPIIN